MAGKEHNLSTEFQKKTLKFVDQATVKYRPVKKTLGLQELIDRKQPGIFTEEYLSKQDSDVSEILRDIKTKSQRGGTSYNGSRWHFKSIQSGFRFNTSIDFSQQSSEELLEDTEPSVLGDPVIKINL